MTSLPTSWLAPLLLIGVRMNVQSANHRGRANVPPMLRWVLTRGDYAVTCQINPTNGRRGYEVCVVPHWNVSETSIEVVTTPAQALQRHAEIAMRMRDAGWSVTARWATC